MAAAPAEAASRQITLPTKSCATLFAQARRAAVATVAAGLACSGLGCVGYVVDAKDNAILQDNFGAISAAIASKSRDHHFDYILQIHFDGNDGIFASDHWTSKYPSELSYKNKMAWDLPIRNPNSDNLATFSPAASPVGFTFANANGGQQLGRFEFRYTGYFRAIRAIDEMLISPKKTLDRTYLIVSAGSHGSSAAEIFNLMLQLKYHKAADLIVIGDGIRQPFAFPLGVFATRTPSAVGINLYQRHSFLSGAPLPGFLNYKVDVPRHERVAGYFGEEGMAGDLADEIASHLILDQKGVHLQPGQHDADIFAAAIELAESAGRPDLVKILQDTRDWGHTFRPNFFKLADAELLIESPNFGVRELGYSGVRTFGAEVDRTRIARQLRARFKSHADYEILRLFPLWNDDTPAHLGARALSTEEKKFLIKSWITTSLDPRDHIRWLVSVGVSRYEDRVLAGGTLASLGPDGEQLLIDETKSHPGVFQYSDDLPRIISKLDGVLYGRPVSERELLMTWLLDLDPSLPPYRFKAFP